jgi:hypothetical protein
LLLLIRRHEIAPSVLALAPFVGHNDAPAMKKLGFATIAARA